MHVPVKVQLTTPPPPAAASPSYRDTHIIKLGVMVYMSKVGEVLFPPVRRKITSLGSTNALQAMLASWALGGL